MSGNVPASTEKNPLRLAQAIRDLFAGRSNAVGSCTLTANQASTTVTATNCGPDSKIFLTPTTANAAAEIGNGTLRVSAVAAGSFTLVHANNAQNDRTFYWGAFG